MAKPRVIFDRCAFHGENFDLLVKSPLLRLTKARRISVYHTASLIEETASLYMKEENRHILRKQLPYLLEICNERWFESTERMWVKELLEQADEKQTVFMPNKGRRDAESLLRKIANGEHLDIEDLQGLKQEKDAIKSRSYGLRQTLVSMRTDVAQKRKEAGKQMRPDSDSFHRFMSNELIHFGQRILKVRLGASQQEAQVASENWSQDPSRFPYTTAFMEGMLYATYYAMSDNKKIDSNSQMDTETLAYLHGTDILVSNETKFMKAAFDVLWAPKGKQYMSTRRFVSFLEQFASDVR